MRHRVALAFAPAVFLALLIASPAVQAVDREANWSVARNRILDRHPRIKRVHD